jgi:putative N6-adenine-specific DNA methylase
VISSYFEGMKNLGLKPLRKYPVINGKLECLFYIYEMYEGSRRKPKNETEESSPEQL